MEEHICPVCGKYYFKYPFEECPVCNWANDVVQEKYPEQKKWGNIMSLNEAREAFKQGIEIY